MGSSIFFEAERQRFFRPLNSTRRELVCACLRALYERLHGPCADYGHNLNRDALKALITPVVRESQNALDLEDGQDEFSALDASDPQALTAALIRALLRDGWLEQFPDRHGLVTAFRLSRPGKVFAEAFWSLSRPSRSRQRNMRGCRNALEAALAERGDAHDIVDAYEYAEKVIEDLTDGIDYLQERIRHLMREATMHAQWDDFVEFLERFQRDYARQLTADSATLNRQAIRQKIEALRERAATQNLQRIETQLHAIAQWAVREYSGPSVLDWLLDRIDEMVNAAWETKQPTLVRAMETYVRRITGLVQQSMMLRTGQNRHAYLSAISTLAGQSRSAQDALLNRIGAHITHAELRLLDPSSFRLRSVSQRRKAATISVQPRPGRAARLDAFLQRAESEAFAISNETLLQGLRRDLALFQHPVKLSSLPLETARDLIGQLQTIEAVRNAKVGDLQATRLPQRIQNAFYSGFDYAIELKKKP